MAGRLVHRAMRAMRPPLHRGNEMTRTISVSAVSVSLASLALAISAPARADDDGSQIIVTATGIAQDRDEAGQSISIIDARTIQQMQSLTVTDLLITTPSVRWSSNGTLGASTGVSLRGAETGQTLVLIDGVRVNDPSGTNGAVDFGNLLTAGIRRIEILRGSNAVPYGSDAIGGVIALSTRDPAQADGFSVRAQGEGGYSGTANGLVDLGWKAGGTRVSASLSALTTDGISSASRDLGATEKDGLTNYTASARVDSELTSNLSIDLRAYAIDAKLDYDSFFGAPADSTDQSHFKQLTTYGGLTLKTGALTSTASFTYLANRRNYYAAPDTPVNFGYRGSAWRGEYRGVFSPIEATTLIFGYSHDAPDYRYFGFGSDEKHKANTDSGYGMLVLKPVMGLTLTGGVRHDDHSLFGGVTTFGANMNWGPGDGKTRFRAAFGQGFRAPSLYQLFDTWSGNAALRPERSESFDVGIDRTLGDGIGQVSLSLFTRTTRNQIDYDMSTYSYFNIARTRAQGFELSATVRPTPTFTVQGAYSYVDARDRTPGAGYDLRLARRAPHSLSLSLDKEWPLGLSTGATATLVGDARDPISPTGQNDGYILLGLRAGFKITERIALFGRIDNLFDADYVTAYGYGTYGRSAYAGARFTL